MSGLRYIGATGGTGEIADFCGCEWLVHWVMWLDRSGGRGWSWSFWFPGIADEVGRAVVDDFGDLVPVGGESWASALWSVLPF